MKKQNSKQVTKEDLRSLKAYIKYEQIVANAEANAKTDYYRGLANTKAMDCTIYSKEDYELFSVFVRNKSIFLDIFTAEQWQALESGVKLYEMNGYQTVKVNNEDFNVIDSLANEAEIAEIAKKLGKR